MAKDTYDPSLLHAVALDSEELKYLAVLIRKHLDCAIAWGPTLTGFGQYQLERVTALRLKIARATVEIGKKAPPRPKKAVSKRPRNPQGRSKSVRPATGPARKAKRQKGGREKKIYPMLQAGVDELARRNSGKEKSK